MVEVDVVFGLGYLDLFDEEVKLCVYNFLEVVGMSDCG